MAEPLDLEKTVPLPKLGPAMFARFRLIGELGRGGMGVVWRAEDTKLEREVALKFLPDLVVRDREAMSDLAGETRRCLELTHPHIVRVYDLIEEGSRAAISMELVDGPSLAERKLAQPHRCFSPSELAPWITQLCAALDYAHTKAHIVHRDLKPLNLLVNAQGDLKVVDFGIARSLVKSGTRLSSELRSASGSLAYVGPQQLLGEPAAVGDDIYSLGVTLFELLTSKTPFHEGDLVTQLREVVPPSMTARRVALGVNRVDPIPPAWEQTIAACLAKRVEDRPRTAGEVAHRLGLTTASAPPALASSANGTTRRRSATRAQVWITGGTTILLAVAAAVFWPQQPLPQASSQPSSTAAGPLSRTPESIPSAPEFVVTVAPAGAAARVWLGRATNVEVPADGRLSLRDLADGEQELNVEAPGFQPYAGRATIAGGRGSAAVTLVAIYGAVQITARPGTLVAAIDPRGHAHPVGTVTETRSLRSDNALRIGTYTFKLTHPDCEDALQPGVTVASARLARVAPVQVPRPGELRVFSTPSGAAVSINGAPAGVTPASLLHQPSEKPLALDVFLPGHRRIRQSVTLKPGETRPITLPPLVAESGAVALQRGAAEFRLARATVHVDGQPVALKNNGRIDGLEVGDRLVEITHVDYEPWQQTVKVRDGQSTTVPVKLVPRPATLLLALTGPTNVSLTANGKVLAVKNGRVALPADEQVTLEIAAPGFKTERRTLTLPPRKSETLTLTMEKIGVPEFGQSWIVPDMELTLVPIAAGQFAMGSDSTGELNERPVTQVTLTKPFWLGRTEVTQREWVALMGSNPSRAAGEQLPVENVAWTDAMEFCRKLTERERAADRLPAGYVYTLPTEAQWEYACRAGTTGDFAGDIGELGWHEENSGGKSHGVATKRANPWGLHDMHGNVWEWCLDPWSEKLKGGSLSDPKGAAVGANRVRRGGSFVIKPSFCRSAFRGLAEQNQRLYNLGFRVALAPRP